jgi:patatin-like phospholipase/acyl hydrolase
MFKILALDGGGIKGAFTAAVLAQLEHLSGRRIVDHFDLIVGTSTGGILAIGLGLGLSPAQLLDLYVERGSAIFPSTGLLADARGLLRQLFGPKHEQGDLRTVLAEYLGDKPFGASRSRLVIPSYEVVRGRINLFKTPHHPRHKFDHATPAVDVALATAAAPTYFNAASLPQRPGEMYVDGGVWANNPVMVGLVEAIAFLDRQPDDIDVLSIGTTDEPRSFSAMKRAGVFRWNVGLIDLLMRGQAESSLALARHLVAGRVYRIDEMCPPGLYTLDGASAGTIQELQGRGRKRASEKEVLETVVARFLDGSPLEEYKPLH